jgi:hypothetical protein
MYSTGARELIRSGASTGAPLRRSALTSTLTVSRMVDDDLVT